MQVAHGDRAGHAPAPGRRGGSADRDARRPRWRWPPRSALEADALAAVLLAWPESWEDDETLTPLMQDLPKEAQRIIYTAAPERVGALVERYARKALTVGARRPRGAPGGPGADGQRAVGAGGSPALADLVELLDPASLVIWTADRSRHGAIARGRGAGRARGPPGDRRRARGAARSSPSIYPRAERLRQLLGAGEVVLLVPPGTESYVARIAAPRRPLRLPGLLDASPPRRRPAGGHRRAPSRPAKPDRALLTLAPLFERHDPAAVAAALFDLWTGAGRAGAGAACRTFRPRSKIYVGVGKKDGATANDLVAVLTKELRVERGKIGRIELRDAYSLVEIPAQEAERVAGGAQRDDDPAEAGDGAGGSGADPRRAGPQPGRRRRRSGRRLEQRLPFPVHQILSARLARKAGTVDGLDVEALPVRGFAPLARRPLSGSRSCRTR